MSKEQEAIIIDVSSIKEEIQQELLDHLNQKELAGFDAKANIHSHNLLSEAAVQQMFTNNKKNLTNTTTEDDIDDIISDNADKTDFNYQLYLPFLRTQSEGWLGHLSASTLPKDKKFFRISFDSMDALNAVAEELVSIFEDSWNDFAYKAFHEIKFRSNYLKHLLQLIVFGNSPKFIDYNCDKNLLDVNILNFKRFAVHPLKADISRATHIYRCSMFLDDILNDPTVDKKLAEKIEESLDTSLEEASYVSENVANEYEKQDYGCVAGTTFFIPWWRSKTDKKFILRNCLITVVRKNQLQSLNDSSNSSHILKIVKFRTRDQNPLLFATFGTTMPGTTYYQSKIYQNLPFQAMANLATAIALQALVLSIFPIAKQKDYGDESTESLEYTPRAVWPVREMEDVEIVDFKLQLGEYLQMMEFIYSLIQKSSGITDTLEGSKTNTSERKTAFETKALYDSGSTRVNVVLDHQEDEDLQPTVDRYVRLTQFTIETQVETARAALGEKATWDLLLEQAPLFRRFLSYSKIQYRIKKLIDDLEMIDPVVGQPIPKNLEKAKQIRRFLDLEAIYKIVIQSFDSSNIIIEGNTGEIAKAQTLEALSSTIELLKNIDAEGATGKKLNIEGIVSQFKKLTNLPNIDLLIPRSEVEVMQAQMEQAQEAQAGQEKQQEESSSDTGADPNAIES